MAPVYRALQEAVRSAGAALQVEFCFSGQHLELALPFLKFFEIQPQRTLDLMQPGQSLGSLTARGMAQFDELFKGKPGEPGVVAALVQGDTTTAFTAALAAFYHRIRVGHVEAGLRTSTIQEPFPEELNRRMITRIADWHYAPTAQARDALAAEHVPAASVLLTGNTGIDALLWSSQHQREPSLPALQELQGSRFVLITAHRRENIGAPLEAIAGAIAKLAALYPDVRFVLPVHKNPVVARTLHGALDGVKNCRLTDPLDYGDLVWAMRNAELIMTDSGGIQEEAPSFLKPVLVLRNETERPEGLDYGTSFLLGSDAAKIVEMARAFLDGKRKLSVKPGPNPFGDGKAAQKIAEHVLRELKT